MRLRANHIALAVFALVVAFVVVTVRMQPRGAAPPPTASLPPLGADLAEGPAIVFEPEHLDLGTVPNDEPTRTTLTVRNAGRATLEIKRVRSECACVQGRVAERDRRVAPGESTRVQVAFLPNAVVGFRAEKKLTVWSNDPVNPHATVDVTADIAPEFELVPEILDFGVVDKANLPEGEIILRQVREEPVILEDVVPLAVEGVAGANDLRLSFSERPRASWRDPEKREYRVTVAFPEDIPPGPVTRIFTLVMNVRRLPPFPVMVHGEVRAPYTVTPAFPRPAVISGTREAPGTATIIVQGDDAPLVIGDISVSGDPLDIQLVEPEDEEATTWRLRAAPADGVVSGTGMSQVHFTVRTDEVVYHDRVVVRGVTRPDSGP